MPAPMIYLIAGCNGAAKTTFANEFLPHEVKCLSVSTTTMRLRAAYHRSIQVQSWKVAPRRTSRIDRATARLAQVVCAILFNAGMALADNEARSPRGGAEHRVQRRRSSVSVPTSSD